MLVYTETRLGPKQSLTPEGYLLCEDVPIARIGKLLYRSQDIKVPSRTGIVQVTRTPEEVFAPRAIASFEGKPVTDGHPPMAVTSYNSRRFKLGHVRNVRRGTGAQADLLLADLLIEDHGLIQDIRNGLREISAGYDADYVETAPGKADQINIVGNHVALVRKGRCGPRCSIGDSAMAIKKKSILKGRTALSSISARIREAIENGDDDALNVELSTLDNASVISDEEGSAHHVHINLGDMGGNQQPPADPIAALMASVAELGNRFTVIEGKLGTLTTDLQTVKSTKEADEAAAAEAARVEAERVEAARVAAAAAAGKTPMTLDTATVTALTAEIAETNSRAEILAPGLNLMTLDSAIPAETTREGLCEFRRKALKTALTTDSTLDVIKVLVPATTDVMGLTCDQATLMFNGAAELMRATRRARGDKPGSNAPAQSGRLLPHAPKAPPTAAELNEKFRKAYAH